MSDDKPFIATLDPNNIEQMKAAVKGAIPEDYNVAAAGGEMKMAMGVLNLTLRRPYVLITSEYSRPKGEGISSMGFGLASNVDNETALELIEAVAGAAKRLGNEATLHRTKIPINIDQETFKEMLKTTLGPQYSDALASMTSKAFIREDQMLFDMTFEFIEGYPVIKSGVAISLKEQEDE